MSSSSIEQTEKVVLIPSLQCHGHSFSGWFVAPFGRGFVILCSACGKNATHEAEVRFGISNEYDTLETAQEHLGLLHYERAP